MSNFKNYSQTPEYLNLDIDNLKKYLNGIRRHNGVSQQTLFDGIVNWIEDNPLRDSNDRTEYVKSLMDIIDFSKLSADNLLNCLTARGDTELTNAIVECFRTPSNRQPALQVILLDDTNGKHSFQFFKEGKWSPLQKFHEAAGSIYCTNAILNDKVYYVNQNRGKADLRVFNTKTRRSATLYSSTDILRDTCMCLKENFIYFCGGYKANGSPSDQILRYDLSAKSVESLTPMKSKRGKAVACFFEEELHVFGGHDGSSKLDSVEKYNNVTNEWSTLAPMLEKRRGHAVAVLNNKMYVCGGFDVRSSEVYDPSTGRWELSSEMNKARFDFLVVPHEEKLLAVGGDKEKTLEVFDPKENRWEIEEKLSTGLQIKHPKGGLSCLTALD